MPRRADAFCGVKPSLEKEGFRTLSNDRLLTMIPTRRSIFRTDVVGQRFVNYQLPSLIIWVPRGRASAAIPPQSRRLLNPPDEALETSMFCC